MLKGIESALAKGCNQTELDVRARGARRTELHSVPAQTLLTLRPGRAAVAELRGETA